MLSLVGFKQTDDSRCGPAAIKSVLYYFGIDSTEDEVAKRCNHSYELGCTNRDMLLALRSYGLGATLIRDSSLEEIEYWITHKIPVIVDWFTSGITVFPGTAPEGHSGVIVGIDRNNVYLLDPENGEVRPISRVDFLRVWFDWETEIENSLCVRNMIIVYPSKLKYDGDS